VVDPGCGLGVGNELVDEGEVNNGGTWSAKPLVFFVFESNHI
jgi:hypothetical protein